jgi:hypothetical protein
MLPIRDGKVMLPHKLLQVHNHSWQISKQTELSHNAKSSAYPSTGLLGLHWGIDLPCRVEQQSVGLDDNNRLSFPRMIVEDGFYRH